MSAHAGQKGVRDAADVVRSPRILGERFIIQVNPAADGIDRDVFKYGAEPLRGCIDLGLRLF